MRCAALILTGGVGQRVKGLNRPKQFYEILGRPVFLHSVDAYEAVAGVDEVYLVINEDFRSYYEEYLKNSNLTKLRKLIVGGENRQISIEKGLTALASEKIDLVVLHDGANPTTYPEFIQTCIEVAAKEGAVTGGISPRDTVVSLNGREIEDVFERSLLAYTCSPQVFRYELIVEAIKHAHDNHLTNRPTVELVKRLNHKVVVVPCPYPCIKITTDEDLYPVEQLLKKRLHARS